MSIRALWLTLIVLAYCAPLSWASAVPTGALAGKVTDPSGAAMSAVTVTIRNISTGVTRTGVTAEDGAYSFIELAPAR